MERMELPPGARLAHPDWLLAALEHAWPDAWERIRPFEPGTRAAHGRLPGQRSPDCPAAATSSVCRGRAFPARATRHSGEGVTLDSPRSAASVPGFDEGLVSVQDEAAQLAARAPRCTGRTTACSTRAQHPEARRRISSNAARTAWTSWRWTPIRTASRTSDRPSRVSGSRPACRSPTPRGTGRLVGRSSVPQNPGRRALFRNRSDSASTPTSRCCARPRRHRRDDAPAGPPCFRRSGPFWPAVGACLYATCSVLSRENESIVRTFLAERAGAEALPIDAPWGHPTGHGRQILPGEGRDGRVLSMPRWQKH